MREGQVAGRARGGRADLSVRAQVRLGHGRPGDRAEAEVGRRGPVEEDEEDEEEVAARRHRRGRGRRDDDEEEEASRGSYCWSLSLACGEKTGGRSNTDTNNTVKLDLEKARGHKWLGAFSRLQLRRKPDSGPESERPEGFAVSLRVQSSHPVLYCTIKLSDGLRVT